MLSKNNTNKLILKIQGVTISWQWCVCSQLSSSAWRGGVKCMPYFIYLIIWLSLESFWIIYLIYGDVCYFCVGVLVAYYIIIYMLFGVKIYVLFGVEIYMLFGVKIYVLFGVEILCYLV